MTRLVARVIGIVVSAYWVMALAGGIFSGEASTPGFEGIALCVIVSATILGFIISWWHLKAGAAVMIVSAMILGVFAYFSAGHNKLLAVASSAVPFLVVGTMLFISDPRTERKMRRT